MIENRNQYLNSDKNWKLRIFDWKMAKMPVTNDYGCISNLEIQWMRF